MKDIKEDLNKWRDTSGFWKRWQNYVYKKNINSPQIDLYRIDVVPAEIPR